VHALRLPHVWPLCMLCTFVWLQVLSRALRSPLRRGQKALHGPTDVGSARLGVLTGFVLFAFLTGHVASHDLSEESFRHLMGLLAFTGVVALWRGARDARPRIELEMAVSALAALSAGQLWAFFLPLTYYTVLLGRKLAAALHEQHGRLATDGALG
jgi:hypothetical protein